MTYFMWPTHESLSVFDNYRYLFTHKHEIPQGVHSKLRLVSTDGSKLEYPDLDTCPLEDYSMRKRRSAPYSSSEFYPGQIVYGPLGTLDNANWLNVTKDMKAARKQKLQGKVRKDIKFFNQGKICFL